MPDKISVLFVCLGNICRSTMAEGVFQAMTQQAPYRDLVGRIDSCGTGAYHTGDQPDERTLATLRSHGIEGYTHKARQLRSSDFDEFDYILAMDDSNLRGIEYQRQRRQQRGGGGPGRARVLLFGSFSGTAKAEEVEDPYYGGGRGFERAYEKTTRFSRVFLQEVLEGVDG